MTKTIIWHNPRCSKSRQTLELIRSHGVEPDVVEYLKTPPTTAEIRAVLNMLGMEPGQLMRKKEAVYRELGLTDTTDRGILIEAMHRNPVLIERPIIIHKGKAALGRPPEAVLAIL